MLKPVTRNVVTRLVYRPNVAASRPAEAPLSKWYRVGQPKTIRVGARGPIYQSSLEVFVNGNLAPIKTGFRGSPSVGKSARSVVSLTTPFVINLTCYT
jgi:hypothetical protein